jgi:hypothetical protein
VGDNPSGKISTSYSTGTVIGNYYVGGLVGSSNYGSITTSYSTSTVTGNHNVGGLVGSSGTITTCYSTGTVFGSTEVGGLVGSGGSITKSYSTGSVSGDENVGGLVSRWAGVNSSFWDTQTSGLASSDGGVGLTTLEMMDPYMLGLNGFANDPNWVLNDGNDYPRLVWEGRTGQIISEPDIDWLAGQGTEENPYEIDTSDQLILLGKASILWDRHFILKADINLDPNLPNGQVYEQAIIPKFTGVCDGNDQVITNLVITGGSHLGLFGQLGNGAVVKNLGVIDVNITGSGYYVGGLVGLNDGEVSNCYSTGTVSGGIYDVGGLVGRNEFNGTITTSYSISIVNGTGFHIGGLVGRNTYGSIVTSYSTGSASGDHDVGGLMGTNSYGNIINCNSTGTVSGDHDVGGLVGWNFEGTITTSYSTVMVTGTGYYIGGFVGINHGGSIANCYSTGAVNGNDGFGVGGLVGINDVYSSITNSYSIGTVNGAGDYTGGLVGRDRFSSINSSFWDVQTTGQQESANGIGKTTAEMQIESTFLEAGWDFVDETENGTDDIWWILEGQDYPRLWWEAEGN